MAVSEGSTLALWKMSNFKPLFAAFAALALLTFSFSASAGYAQLKIPPGWSAPKNTGSPATFKTGPSANQNTYKGSTVLTNASLEIGGQLVQVPASMRIAANASIFAATYALGNPYLFGALAVTSAAYIYYQQKGLTVENGIWVKSDPNVCTASPCSEYLVSLYSSPGSWSLTPTAAFNSSKATLPPGLCGSNCTWSMNITSCTPTSCSYNYVTKQTNPNDGTVQTTTTSDTTGVNSRPGSPQPAVKAPIGDVEFHTIMDPVPVPTAVPKELPDIEWPVEQPAINPSPSTIPSTFPSPATPPASVPFWVPTGDPVKDPNSTPTTKPDTWTQPGKDVKPAATPTDPWRVDVTDAPKTKADATPNTTTATKTTATPTPVDTTTCGLPGTPKCAIDETGTPKYDPKTLELDRTSLDPASKAQREQVSKTMDKPMFNPFSQFFVLPPLRDCTPVVMPMIGSYQIASMNVCPGAEWLRGLMGFVWAAAGFAFVFKTVQDVI